MRKLIEMSMALALLSSWACTEIEIITPVSPSVTNELRAHLEKKPITLDQLREIQQQKRAASKNPPCNSSMAHPVHPEPQETLDWCWAATSRTVMSYHDGKIGTPTHSQCQIVSHAINPKFAEVVCCPSDMASVKPECMGGGWPSSVFEKHNFDYEVLRGAITDWKVLTEEICGTGPFVYIIDLPGGGKHALLAVGYGLSSNQRFVLIYDPTQEDFEYITHEEFFGNVLDPDGSRPYSHNRNYVQISRQIGNQP